MQKFILKALTLAGLWLVVGVGCGQSSSSSKKFLIPVLNLDGQTELKEVTLETLYSRDEVHGEAARVLYNPMLSESGVSGGALKTRLSQSGDLNIPMDYETSSALSVYYIYQNLKKFDDRVLQTFSLSWPRTVGLDLRFAGVRVANNAFYAAIFDFTGIVPYSLERLPMSYNSGILAHEHFHAHFFQLMGKVMDLSPKEDVWNPHNHMNARIPGSGCGISDASSLRMSKTAFDREVNNNILSAWNEGFADLYGAIATQNSNFFEASIPLDKLRSVEEEAPLIFQRSAFENALKSDMTAASEDCQSDSLYYQVGTQIARTVFQKINAGDFDFFEKENANLSRQERGLRYVFTTLRAAAPQMGALMKTGSLAPDWIVQQLKAPKVPELPQVAETMQIVDPPPVVEPPQVGDPQ